MVQFSFESLPVRQIMAGLETHPWDYSLEPFRVAPHIYYVGGQTWVGAYILDTGDGLILLDSGDNRTVYA